MRQETAITVISYQVNVGIAAEQDKWDFSYIV
jgi:hypothetical protein